LHELRQVARDESVPRITHEGELEVTMVLVPHLGQELCLADLGTFADEQLMYVTALGLTRLREPIRVKRSGSVKGAEMMDKTGRRYSPEFKQEALPSWFRLPMRTIPKIARDLGGCTQTLRK
jgi:hypothetical protein